MKQLETGSSLRILIIILLLAMAGWVNAQVYKSVDENGTVIYSESPPEKGAQPFNLPPISVIEAPEYKKAPTAPATQPEKSKELSLRGLRQKYRDFAIVSPKQDDSVWRPDGPVTAAWNTRLALQQGMWVSLVLDGQALPPTTAQIVSLGNLDRGEHTLQALLIDRRKRTIATAATVTFYVRQPNLFSNPRAAPAGGGG